MGGRAHLDACGNGGGTGVATRQSLHSRNNRSRQGLLRPPPSSRQASPSPKTGQGHSPLASLLLQWDSSFSNSLARGCRRWSLASLSSTLAILPAPFLRNRPLRGASFWVRGQCPRHGCHRCRCCPPGLVSAAAARCGGVLLSSRCLPVPLGAECGQEGIGVEQAPCLGMAGRSGRGGGALPPHPGGSCRWQWGVPPWEGHGVAVVFEVDVGIQQGLPQLRDV